MKIVRTVFAPVFWLRDIRDSLVQMESLLRWMFSLEVGNSPLSTKAKKELLAAMLQRTKGAKNVSPEDILRALGQGN